MENPERKTHNEKFPRKIRLHYKKDFQAVFRSAFLDSAHVRVFFKKNELGFSRFGIVASRKIKKAVERNNAKRKIREIIRKNKYTIPSGYDFIILVKVALKDIEYRLLEEELMCIFKRI